jgi:hypothetical protein
VFAISLPLSSVKFLLVARYALVIDRELLQSPAIRLLIRPSGRLPIQLEFPYLPVLRDT